MNQKNRWLFLLIPNLVFLVARGVPAPNRVFFDESYRGQDFQLWLKYEENNPRRFQGVLTSLKEEKRIWGFREGGFFFLWSDDSAWTGEILKEQKHCEPILKLSSLGRSLKPFSLRADYC